MAQLAPRTQQRCHLVGTRLQGRTLLPPAPQLGMLELDVLLQRALGAVGFAAEGSVAAMLLLDFLGSPAATLRPALLRVGALRTALPQPLLNSPLLTSMAWMRLASSPISSL